MLKSKCCGKEAYFYRDWTPPATSVWYMCSECDKSCEVVEEPIWDENVFLEGNGQGNYHLVKKPQPPTESWIEDFNELYWAEGTTRDMLLDFISALLSQAEARHREEKKELFKKILNLPIMPWQEHDFIDTCDIHKLKAKYLKE